MEILKAISERRAYRHLSPEALPDGAARRIVEAGHLAPSCFNNQPWRIVAASGESLAGLREALSEANAWAAKAPLIIAVTTKEADDCRLDDGRDYFMFDAGLCSMNMILQASSEGLVAHPIAGYNPKKAKSALGIDKDRVLATLIVIARKGEGSPESNAAMNASQKASEGGPRSRKPIDEVASFV